MDSPPPLLLPLKPPDSLTTEGTVEKAAMARVRTHSRSFRASEVWVPGGLDDGCAAARKPTTNARRIGMRVFADAGPGQPVRPLWDLILQRQLQSERGAVHGPQRRGDGPAVADVPQVPIATLARDVARGHGGVPGYFGLNGHRHVHQRSADGACSRIGWPPSATLTWPTREFVGLRSSWSQFVVAVRHRSSSWRFVVAVDGGSSWLQFVVAVPPQPTAEQQQQQQQARQLQQQMATRASEGDHFHFEAPIVGVNTFCVLLLPDPRGPRRRNKCRMTVL